MKPLIDRSSITPSSIFCVGKNYADHAKEMEQWEPAEYRNDIARQINEEPVIFMKPATSLAVNDRTSIPSFRGKPLSLCMHYEVELVILIDRDAVDIAEHEASRFIRGYGVGLDMTLRDVQIDAKRTVNPWLKCKGFRHSALVSDFVPAESVGDWKDLEISLRCNDRQVQHAGASQMISPPAYLIHYLSYIYGLRSNDLIFTGTPSGVGQVSKGDILFASLEHHMENAALSSNLVDLRAIVM
jgi:2-keto-4-pentenoate hydratase/2-oxohepta-3-ene-1,7-dioic acid hydratase in catechol pathway